VAPLYNTAICSLDDWAAWRWPLAAYGWLKRKAIATAVGGLRHAAGQRFWDYLRRQLQADEKPGAPATKAPPIYEKTYRGIFHGYNQYANSPKEHFFTLFHDGTTVRVPVMQTNLLSGVQHGEFVEIDTKVCR
jgi:hypothetical protein